MRRLVLAGLGHAHLPVLRAWARGELGGAALHVVAPPDYHYSGMIPGVVAGVYTPEQARLDPAALCRAAGAAYTPARVRRVDAAARRLRLDDGGTLDYDLLSLDLGSRPAGLELPGVAEHAFAVRPLEQVLRFREAAERACARASATAPARLAIVGGGAAGVELAFCLHAALTRRHRRERVRLRLLEAGETILAGYTPRLQRRAQRLLRGRGVEVRTAVRVEAAEAGALQTSAGPLPCDAVLWAGGPRAPRLLRASGLPTDAEGWLRVETTLRAVGLDDVFGAGDCAALEGYGWMAKAGVYAVRQGPLLARNLAHALAARPLERYRPQRHWLSLLNTGDGRALLAYRGLVLHGRAAWRLKDAIDRAYLRRVRPGS